MTADYRGTARALAGALAGAILVSMAGPAAAHAHLIASTPAANAVIAAPGNLTLQFSEKLIGRFSGLDLTDADGHKLGLTVLPPFAQNEISAQPLHPLKPGTYQVKWHAVGDDAHRMEGQFAFQVR